MIAFGKRERANISAPELEALHLLAESLLRLSPHDLDAQVARASLEEICHDHAREGQVH